MTKYVVSGYIGFDNFGDEAIASVLTKKLKVEGAESITLISSNPSKTAELYGVKSCGMLDFIRPIMECNTLISGGGSLLQDVTSIKSLIYYLGVIYTAMGFGKKVEIFAQGIGPINSKIGRFFTKFALKNASKISVRDKKSQELLKSWGINSELVKDPIFDIEIPQTEKKEIVGIQLRDFKGVNESFLNSLADKIINGFSNKKFEIFSLQDSIDLNVCKQFEKILRSKGIENVEILSNLSINDVIEKISELEILVAMRFHANVIGIKAGVKTIAINYDPKVQKLAEEYNLELIELHT